MTRDEANLIPMVRLRDEVLALLDRLETAERKAEIAGNDLRVVMNAAIDHARAHESMVVMPLQARVAELEAVIAEEQQESKIAEDDIDRLARNVAVLLAALAKIRSIHRIDPEGDRVWAQLITETEQIAAAALADIGKAI